MKGLDLQIEQFKINKNYDSYIETLVDFCEANQVDVEDIVSDLSPSTIKKIKYEFIQLNMVKGEKIETSLDKFFGGD